MRARLGAARWRALHRLAYAGFALAMVHGVLAGTDTGRWWATGLYVAGALQGEGETQGRRDHQCDEHTDHTGGMPAVEATPVDRFEATGPGENPIGDGRTDKSADQGVPGR